MFRRRLALTAAAVSLLGLLAACSGGDDEGLRVTDDSSPGAALSAAPTVSGDANNFKVESESGNVTGTTGLPEGFPSDIPLVDGNLVQGTRIEGAQGNGWTVSFLVPRPVETVQGEITKQLTGAGFAAGNVSAADGFAQASFTQGKRQIIVSLATPAGGGQTEVTYVVTAT